VAGKKEIKKYCFTFLGTFELSFIELKQCLLIALHFCDVIFRSPEVTLFPTHRIIQDRAIVPLCAIPVCRWRNKKIERSLKAFSFKIQKINGEFFVRNLEE
jgi:hypothetical protein